MNGTINSIFDSDKRFLWLAYHGFYNNMPDQEYLERKFKAKLGYQLNLDAPKTYNEKIQWLKLHDRNPLYNTLVDKYAVKQYVASIIGEEYIIPTLGVWDRFDDIDFSRLPNQFVLKCTHDSGGLVIVRDKKTLDINGARAKINRSLKKNYYYLSREWPYKDVPPRIIAEQCLTDESGDDLKDYKVLCFGGEPKLIELHTGRYTSHQTQDFYDTGWNKTKISQTGIASFQVNPVPAPKPVNLKEMLDLSRVLSKDMIHVRVDWYSVYGKLYFGELTLYDGSGLDAWDRKEDDLLLGSWIRLPIEADKP